MVAVCAWCEPVEASAKGGVNFVGKLMAKIGDVKNRQMKRRA